MTSSETKRLGVQREDVLRVMLDIGGYLTFEEIQRAIEWRTDRHHSEASISARLRDFRKARYGAYIVDRRKRSGSLYEYRVRENPSKIEQLKFSEFLESHA
jgi:hypothetical protein